MKDWNDKLIEAAKKQRYTTFYDMHISSPLIDLNAQPVRTKEEKKSDNFTIRLPLWIRKRLEEISEDEEMSINNMIINAIISAIELHDDRAEAIDIWLRKYEDAKKEITYNIKLGDEEPENISAEDVKTFLNAKDIWEEKESKNIPLRLKISDEVTEKIENFDEIQKFDIEG